MYYKHACMYIYIAFTIIERSLNSKKTSLNLTIYVELIVYGGDTHLRPLMRFPDSSVSSLICSGWCEEDHSQNLNFPRDIDTCL